MRRWRNELGQEIGPLGPTKLGAPVAVLDIPSIGVRDAVVVEGTTPQALELGPGHLRNTPLPGQLGMSVLYGRRATFGAPFANIDRLRPGDKITAITQQGTSVYKVVAIGDSQHPVTDPTLNRLVLLTASSPDVPAYYLEIDADLVSAAQNGYVQLPVHRAVRTGDGRGYRRARDDHDLGTRARAHRDRRCCSRGPVVAVAGLPGDRACGAGHRLEPV